jgi:transcriptional regulator of acetoin/glycerol metabolism
MDQTPGILLVVAAHEPVTLTRPLDRASITIGRDPSCALSLKDAELSRRHCDVAYLGDGRFRIIDHGSQNGTYVNERAVSADGRIVDGEPIVVRAGGSVFLLERDVTRYAAGVTVEDDVVGPMLRIAYDAIERAAREGRNLIVDGENGTGKERAARVFHAASRNANGRFLAVNCATSECMRELSEAEGGVVFLDQLDALRPAAQRALLARAESVRGALVVATTGMDDRYARVVLPPLRERRAEIPFLVVHALRGRTLEPTASLMEQCLLRPWPANVRELVGAVQAAARAAMTSGSDRVSANDLPPWAGVAQMYGSTTTPEITADELPLVHVPRT